MTHMQTARRKAANVALLCSALPALFPARAFAGTNVLSASKACAAQGSRGPGGTAAHPLVLHADTGFFMPLLPKPGKNEHALFPL